MWPRQPSEQPVEKRQITPGEAWWGGRVRLQLSHLFITQWLNGIYRTMTNPSFQKALEAESDGLSTDRGGGDTQQEGQSDIATGQAGQLELWENTNMHMKSTHNIQAMLFERLAHIPTPQLDIMANILAHAFASSCTRRHCQIIKVSAEPRPLIGDKKDVPITCFSK